NINRESGIESCGIGASIGLELGVGKSYSEKGGKTENKRRVSTKKEFLRSIIDKSPKWMKQWLRKGKNPPGYHVHHQKPLYKGGSDAIENMRLIDIDMHKIITAIWRGMR
ncbi:MAG: HNH endonuclease, partial [Candidatus Omnitrophica bacterium]|nr:HNH endonuclease [Candidatus Omnitrophota bacterium]